MNLGQRFMVVLAASAALPLFLVAAPTESFATSASNFCSDSGTPSSQSFVTVVEGDQITLTPVAGTTGTYSPPGTAQTTPFTSTIVINVLPGQSGQWNLTNSIMSCEVKGALPTTSSSASNNFLENRTDTLASTDIDLSGRLGAQNGGGSSGSGSSPLNVAGSGTSGSGLIAFNTSLGDMKNSLDVQPAGNDLTLRVREGRTSQVDVWIKGQYSWTRNEGQRADLGLLYLGTDYRISPDVVLGLLGQFDWTDERDRDAGSRSDGFGWMVGPYVVARLHDHLVFDARGAVGTSDNEVTTIFGAKGDFDTTRWLVKGQLTGDWAFDSFDLNPFVKVIYIEEDREKYTDSLGVVIGSRTVSLGRLQFGPRISTSFDGGNGMIVTPHLTVSGIYDFDRAGRLTPTGLSSSTDRARAKIESGLGVTMPGGVRIDGEAYYDGIGVSKYDIYGGSLKVNVPLN